MPADAEMCDVCRNERKKSKKKDAPVIQICPECNENPVVPGEEFCAACLREHKRLEAIEKIALNQQDALDEEEEEALEEALAAEEETEDLDKLDFVQEDTDDIPEEELEDMEEELGLDDEDEEDGLAL
jgi:hypothetical protein